MKKYKLLRFGKCYISLDGDFIIQLLDGSKKEDTNLFVVTQNQI